MLNIPEGYVKVAITDPEDSSKRVLEALTKIVFIPPQEKKEPINEGLNLPKVIPIYQRDWNPLDNEIESEEDVATMKRNGNDCTVFVNMDWKHLKYYIAHNHKEKEIIESNFAHFCGLYWMSFISKEDLQNQAKEQLKTFLPFVFVPFLELVKKSYFDEK